MARTVTLPVQTPNKDATPLAVSYSTMATGANNGVKAPGHAIIHVKNATGGAATLTVITPGAPGGNPIADKTITVPTASDRFLNLSDDVYRNSDGLVYVDSDVACTIAAIGRT